MGIAKGAVALLYELKRTTTLSGAICQLGRQDLALDAEQLQRIAERFGFTSPARGPLTDLSLFMALGFDTVESIDYSDFEMPTHVHDMNEPVPEALLERYDVIFDGGTLEHVFNFPAALKNIHAMLKPGGLIIHSSPSHNHVDHGFYMFSPTVFNDYYRANRYEIVRFFLFEYERDHAGRPWLVYNYTPAAIAHLSYGGWGKKLLGIWCVARKTPGATSKVVPQQGYYLKAWGHERPVEMDAPSGFLARARRILIGNAFLEPKARILWKALQSVFPRIGLRRPKVIAKY